MASVHLVDSTDEHVCPLCQRDSSYPLALPSPLVTHAPSTSASSIIYIYPQHYINTCQRQYQYYQYHPHISQQTPVVSIRLPTRPPSLLVARTRTFLQQKRLVFQEIGLLKHHVQRVAAGGHSRQNLWGEPCQSKMAENNLSAVLNALVLEF